MYNSLIKAGFIVSVFCMVFTIKLAAQSSGQSADDFLQFTQTSQSRKTLYVKEGQKITVVYKDGSVDRLKGRLENIQEDGFSVNGKVVSFEEVSKIKVRRVRRKTSRNVWTGVTIFSLLVAGLGYLIFLGGLELFNVGTFAAIFFSLIFIMPIGISIAGTGVLLFFIGFIPLIFVSLAGKSFDLINKWTVRKVTINSKVKP